MGAYYATPKRTNLESLKNDEQFTPECYFLVVRWVIGEAKKMLYTKEFKRDTYRYTVFRNCEIEFHGNPGHHTHEEFRERDCGAERRHQYFQGQRSSGEVAAGTGDRHDPESTQDHRAVHQRLQGGTQN